MPPAGAKIRNDDLFLMMPSWYTLGMRPTRKAYDLSAIVDKLEAARYKPLITAIKAFHAAESVGIDLAAAAESVRLLKGLDKSISDDTSHMGSALLVHAVVVYSRATHSQAVSRFNVGVTSAYDNLLKAKHREIVELRDKCIAHFGPGKDGWHVEHVVYLETPKGNGVTMTHRRTNYSLRTVENLDMLINIAIPYVIKLQNDRANDINAALKGNDIELWKLIDEHRFDLDGFLAPAGMSEKAWDDGAFSRNLWEPKRN